MMNKHLLSLIFFVLATTLCFSFQQAKAANGESYNLSLKKQNDDDPKQDPDEKGHRVPSRPIPCIIQESGIITSIDPDDIVSYEIWDIDGYVCIAAFTEELEFTKYIFSCPGEYQIRLSASDCYYMGYLATLKKIVVPVTFCHFIRIYYIR